MADQIIWDEPEPVWDDEVDFSVVEMLSNVPDSAVQYADDATYPIRHPQLAAEGVWNIVKGVGDKIGLDLDNEDQSHYADSVGEFISNRYGSVDKFQRSLQEDPVGVSSDIAGLLSVVAAPFTGGASIPGAAPAVSRFLGKLGGAAKTASKALDPAVGAARVAGAVGRKLDPNDMYQEVMKFSTVKTPAERRQWAQTLLDERIVPGEAGANKLSKRIQEVGDDLNQRIDASDATIPVEDVLTPLDDLRAQKSGFKSGSVENTKAIDDYVDKFIADHGLRGNVTLREVQDFKTDLYDQINYDKKPGAGTLIKDDINKSAARGAKEAIEAVDPEIGGINRKWGDFIDAQKPLERSSARIDNRNPLGLQTPMAGIAAETVLPGSGAVALGANMAYGPKTKARVAIAINELQKNGGDIGRVSKELLQGMSNAQVQQLLVQAGRAGQEDDLASPLQPPMRYPQPIQ